MSTCDAPHADTNTNSKRGALRIPQHTAMAAPGVGRRAVARFEARRSRCAAHQAQARAYTFRVTSPPTRFGKYRLYDRIAVGGMAEIFFATKPGAPELSGGCIIKRVLPHLAGEKQFI